jgi:hypothetical protein
MAAVTVVSSDTTVMGNRRVVAATVTVATTGDTWTVPGVKKIFSVQTSPATAIVNGVTTSGAVITFLSAASSPTQVTLIGI